MTKLALTRRLPADVEARAVKLGDTHLNHSDVPWSVEDFRSSDAEIIVCTVSDRLDAQVIGALGGQVRLLANFGVGVSHIDLDAANDRGIAVTNTPDVLTDATAEIAMLLILGAARRASEGEALVRSGRWQGWAPTALLGTALAGKTLGIFGMGRIGSATAVRAISFGMSVIYHGRAPRSLPFSAEFVADVEAFWPRCDFLSIHAALTDATRGVINAETINRLPQGAIFVNTARGELVDDDALIAALECRRIAAAGLDVFTGEPHLDPRYVALANTFLLPHLGSATVETRTAMGMRALENVEAFIAGRPLADRVA